MTDRTPDFSGNLANVLETLDNPEPATPATPTLDRVADNAAQVGASLPVVGPAVRAASMLPHAGELAESDTLVGAALRQWNTVASTYTSPVLAERVFPTNETPVSTDELIANLDRDAMWGFEDQFLETQTQGEYDARRNQILRELDDRQMLEDASLWASVPVVLAAATLDAPSLIPFGWTARGASILGRGALAAGAETALAAGVSATASEAVFQATQETRSIDESLANVGGSILLGGVLGSGAKFVTDQATGASVKRVFHDWWSTPDYGQRLVNQARGAWEAVNDEIAARVAANRRPTKKQLAEQTKAFDALASAEERLKLHQDLALAKAGPLEWARTAVPRFVGQFNARWLDPIDFLFKRSQSAAARQAAEQIIEVPVLLNKNLSGEATALAASTEIDPFIGGWATFRDRMMGGSVVGEAKRKAGLGDSFYAQARQAGFQGNFRAFDSAVDVAVRNGFVDPHGNPVVTKAAQSMKELIIDPVTLAAKEAGIEFPDSPLGALGYAPRKYKIREVMGPDGQGGAFKATVAKHQFDKLLDEAREAGATLTPQKVAGLRRSAKKFADETFKSVTQGHIAEESGLHGSALSGGSPFKARVVPVPDSVLAANDWIETSATALMDSYLRQTVPTVLIGKRFKTPDGLPDPGLEKSAIPSVVKEYEQLASVAKSAAEREAIQAEGAQTVAMLRNLRDGFLHADRFTPKSRWHSRLNNSVALVKTYQVTRLMGGLLVSSLPDVSNFIIRQGPGRFAKNVGQSFLKAAKLEGLRGKQVAAEAKRLGAAVEWATNASVAASADLLSPFNSVSTPVSRFVHNTARAFSISNGSVWWNDLMRSAAYRASVDRVLEAAEHGWDHIPKSERTFLAHLGIDKPGLNRIGAAWRSQSDPLNDGFLRWATVTDWDDAEAARIFAGALNKDVASTIVRPRLGDRAIGFSGPLASLVFQFQSFLMSHSLRTLTLAEQRVIANGPISSDALRVYVGFGSAIATGWLAELLYAVAKDAVLPDDERRHVEELANNPGQHLARGIDRSSVLGLFSQANAYYERLGGAGLTRALQESAEDENLALRTRGRWLGSEPLQTIMGPTFGEVADLLRTGIRTARVVDDNGEFSKRDARTLRQASPFQNHILLRGIFNEAEKWLAEDVMEIPD